MTGCLCALAFVYIFLLKKFHGLSYGQNTEDRRSKSEYMITSRSGGGSDIEKLSQGDSILTNLYEDPELVGRIIKTGVEGAEEAGERMDGGD